MGTIHIPSHNTAVAPATGATATTAIPVPAIKSGDSILAVIISAPVDEVAGLDVSDFTAGSGTITAATIDTSDQSLVVIHTT